MDALAQSQPSRRARRRSGRGLWLFPIVLPLFVIALAVTFIAHVLWPRWPRATEAVDAPTLPVSIGEVTFNVPPAAIRVAAQRRPGTQERLDLVFQWPSLAPPVSQRPLPPAVDAAPSSIDRIFVTIVPAGDTLAPVVRLRTIYPRYLAGEPDPAGGGLVALAFRPGSPYHGEDLIYDFAQPERFFLRCSRPGGGRVPGMCLAERRIGNADITLRFPRDWLEDWQAVAAGLERLLRSLRPPPAQ